MEKCEEDKILSLEQGRKLVQNTSLSNLNNEQLQELLEGVKVFCEINFEIYLDIISKHKMKEMDDDFDTETVIPTTENNDGNLMNEA
jgi:hypothetical protein